MAASPVVKASTKVGKVEVARRFWPCCAPARAPATGHRAKRPGALSREYVDGKHTLAPVTSSTQTRSRQPSVLTARQQVLHPKLRKPVMQAHHRLVKILAGLGMGPAPIHRR